MRASEGMKRLNGWLAECRLASYRPFSLCSRRGRGGQQQQQQQQVQAKGK